MNRVQMNIKIKKKKKRRRDDCAFFGRMQSIVVLHKRNALFLNKNSTHAEETEKCQCVTSLLRSSYLFPHCARTYLAFILFDFRIHNKRYALNSESGIWNPYTIHYTYV